MFMSMLPISMNAKRKFIPRKCVDHDLPVSRYQVIWSELATRSLNKERRWIHMQISILEESSVLPVPRFKIAP